MDKQQADINDQDGPNLFVRSAIDRKGITKQRYSRWISILIVVLLIVAGIGFLVQPYVAAGLAVLSGTRFSASERTGATPTRTLATPTSDTMGLRDTAFAFPSPGWVASKLDFATSIAFARSDSLTAYACGTGGKPDAAEPVTFAATHDGGATWHITSTTVPLSYCHISVDPANAQDIIMTDQFCPSIDGQCPLFQHQEIQLFRSGDGGTTWKQVQLPAALALVPDIGGFNWAGTTLFVSADAVITTPTRTYWLASSLLGGDLTWVSPDPHLTVPSLASYTHGNDLYLKFAQLDDATLLKTSDGGATWSPTVIGPYNEGIPTLFSSSGDAWYSSSDSATPHGGMLLESLDAGQHWRPLPPLPMALNTASLKFWHAPDGALYRVATDANAQQLAIAQLLPTESSWKAITTIPMSFTFLGVEYSLDGHPRTIWSSNRSSAYGWPKPGLQYHAP